MNSRRRQIHRASGWLLLTLGWGALSFLAAMGLRTLWVEVHPLVAVGVGAAMVAIVVHIASDNPDSLSL